MTDKNSTSRFVVRKVLSLKPYIPSIVPNEADIQRVRSPCSIAAVWWESLPVKDSDQDFWRAWRALNPRGVEVYHRGRFVRGDGVDSQPGNLSKGLWKANRDATAACAQRM